MRIVVGLVVEWGRGQVCQKDVRAAVVSGPDMPMGILFGSTDGHAQAGCCLGTVGDNHAG